MSGAPIPARLILLSELSGSRVKEGDKVRFMGWYESTLSLFASRIESPTV